MGRYEVKNCLLPRPLSAPSSLSSLSFQSSFGNHHFQTFLICLLGCTSPTQEIQHVQYMSNNVLQLRGKNLSLSHLKGF